MSTPDQLSSTYSEREALNAACLRLQAFLDTFGDLGDCETQADLNDWIAAPTALAGWECMGRKQTLPEPGECHWPDCGCDPYATKVIQSLVEQGIIPSQ